MEASTNSPLVLWDPADLQDLRLDHSDRASGGIKQNLIPSMKLETLFRWPWLDVLLPATSSNNTE